MRELDELEAAVDRARERLRQGGLAGAGIVLEQHVAAAREGGEESPDRAGLAAHHRLDVLRELLEDVRRLEAHAPTQRFRRRPSITSSTRRIPLPSRTISRSPSCPQRSTPLLFTPEVE